MRFLALLYGRFDRSNTPSRFNRFYSLDPDPFGAQNSKYELSKQERLLELLGRRRFGNALDVGCGNGFLTRRIAEHCDRLTGIDFAEKAIQLARKTCQEHPNIDLRVEDVRAYNSGDPFDLIVCSEVLYYLQGSELDAAVDRLSGMASSDGWLALVGRAEAELVPAALSRRFQRAEHVEDRDWYRPYAVSIYHPKG